MPFVENSTQTSNVMCCPFLLMNLLYNNVKSKVNLVYRVLPRTIEQLQTFQPHVQPSGRGDTKDQVECSLLVDSRVFVYYESMKRKIKIKSIYECRCNGRLQTKRFTHLTHTGLVVELEHLKIKTRLTNEKFASVKGECEI